MIYYTGDIHGDPYEVIQFCDSKKLTEQDTLVLLGDVGANYYRNRRDGGRQEHFLWSVSSDESGHHSGYESEAKSLRTRRGSCLY